MLPIAVLLALIVAPLAFAALGAWGKRGEAALRPASPQWNWRLVAASTLAYVLAFNLVFFVQEVFLVLPKALLPGVRSTLFHNNHGWDGTHPMVELFQGTGALATLLLGLGCAAWLHRGRGSATLRLLLFWLAFCGVYMALPQVVLGAIEPRGDVGRAMTWLGMGAGAKTVAALLALLAIPLFAQGLRAPLLSLAEAPAQLATARARHRFVFAAATLPALLASALVIPFRVPREWIEVLLVPVMVAFCGLVWLQASAWRDVAVHAGEPRGWRPGPLLLAALALLAVFQLVLRPGITFG
jgi:hypothetical protein